MSPNANPPVLKIKTMMAAADANCTAVALTEHSAGFVSFQRHQPSLPPDTNVNSALRSLKSAVQFSGNNAIYDHRECKCSNNCNIYNILNVKPALGDLN